MQHDAYFSPRILRIKQSLIKAKMPPYKEDIWMCGGCESLAVLANV